MVNDPLFGGVGESVDPGLLLTPAEGRRARISVISFIGLPNEEQRQSFVNQLQMALFAWIKRHPAGERPLGGLFVMDEAQTLAPSGAMTACTQSTLALASQARKYGLGLVFATQSPKGLHNRIPGNAATQFFGLLNAPVQIAAAREMAQAKGGNVPDIARLRSGEFYAAFEGAAFEKVRVPLCLSYHPKSPLTTEEVLDRARNHR
jgi:DNA helicase HerA-like ATPase